MSRNAALKATLQNLKTPGAVTEVGQTETQKKAATALKIIDMSETELNLKQAIDKEELMVKQLHATIKEKNDALKKVQTDIDKERSSGKAVWETVGISTVSYRDPFHTGLSKRTPTGARARNAAATAAANCLPRMPSSFPFVRPNALLTFLMQVRTSSPDLRTSSPPTLLTPPHTSSHISSRLLLASPLYVSSPVLICSHMRPPALDAQVATSRHKYRARGRRSVSVASSVLKSETEMRAAF